MPTYEYQCDACGKKFEKFQSISAAPIRKCPFCNENKVRRLIGMGSGLIFKGSGFYATDYRSDSYKKSAKSESAPAAGKGDSKPLPAADAKPAKAAAVPATKKAKT